MGEKIEASKPDANKPELFAHDDGDDNDTLTPLQNEIFKPTTSAATLDRAAAVSADATEAEAKDTVPAAGNAAAQDVSNAEAAVNEDDVPNDGDPPKTVDTPAPAAEQAAEKTVVTDKAEAAAAKADEPIDPYAHLDRANLLKLELEALEGQKKKPDEVIAIRVDGELKNVKVSDRVEQLKRGLIDEITLAKKGADSIYMVGDATNPGVDDIAKMTIVERDKQAKALGLDGKTVTVESIGRELTKSVGDNERQTKLKGLLETVATVDALSKLHFAPTLVRLLETEYGARGYLDPKMQLSEVISDEQLKKSFDSLKAIPLPGTAADIAAFGADSKPIREAKEVYAITSRTLELVKLDQQQKRALSVLEETNLAAKPGEDAEAHFKKAIQMAEKLDVGYLTMAATKPENAADNMAQEIVDTIRMGSNARLKYAEHLVNNGRFHEAQGLMAKVKADSPELIFAMENDKPVYRKYENGKRSYEELDRVVTLGVTVRPATFELAHSILLEKLDKDKLGDDKSRANFAERLKKGEFPKDVDKIKQLRTDDAGALECFEVMARCRDQFKQDIGEANKILDKEVERVEKEKQRFDGKENLSKEDEVEKARLEREIASLNVTKAQREEYLNRIDALTDYTNGLLDLSRGGAKSAHKLFDSALAKDPSLDAELKRMQGDNPYLKTLTELSKITDNTAEAYWQRNYKKFAIAGAATVGTLTGVGLIGMCGYVGAGVTTTAVVATTGGAMTGGVTSWAIHRTVNEKAGWPEFRDGAKVGGLSAALVVSPWAAQAYRAKLGTDVAVNSSAIGNLVSKIGLTKGTLGGSLAMSYTLEAGNIYFDKKPLGKAAIDGTKDGVFNSLLLGISRGWGMPMEAQAARAGFLNRTAVGTSVVLAGGPQAVDVLANGKSVKDAASETFRDSLTYLAMFGVAKHMKPTEAGKATWLSSMGVNKYTILGGSALAAAPEVRNYFDGRKTGAEAGKDFLYSAAYTVPTAMFLKKYGLSDHGTGSRIAAPTMVDTAGYAKRAFLMQESWNVAVSVGSQKLLHDLGRQPYYIKDQGSGFMAPLIAEFVDYNWGAQLDPNHLGDRKVINSKVDELHNNYLGGVFSDKKNVKPLSEEVPKKGLFFDYSGKKPPKPQK